MQRSKRKSGRRRPTCGCQWEARLKTRGLGTAHKCHALPRLRRVVGRQRRKPSRGCDPPINNSKSRREILAIVAARRGDISNPRANQMRESENVVRERRIAAERPGVCLGFYRLGIFILEKVSRWSDGWQQIQGKNQAPMLVPVAVVCASSLAPSFLGSYFLARVLNTPRPQGRPEHWVSWESGHARGRLW